MAHGHVVALEGRACTLSCASLREACARFCHGFAKIICSPVTGTCLAELSKPCANLAQTLRCLAVLLHLVGGPLLKEKEKTCQRHSNVHLAFFFLLYLFGKWPYTYIYIYIYRYMKYIYTCVCVCFSLSFSLILG